MIHSLHSNETTITVINIDIEIMSEISRQNLIGHLRSRFVHQEKEIHTIGITIHVTIVTIVENMDIV